MSIARGEGSSEFDDPIPKVAPSSGSLCSRICLAMAVRKAARARVLHRLDDEDGTISILTIGLFMVTVAMLILVTDIASISVSKQSLVHASESAAIRASHSVDLRSYYKGYSGVSVPIDCQAAYGKVIEDLNQWVEGGSDIHRTELEQISLTDFSCTGNRVRISTSARAVLPFRLPQASSFVEIHTTVEAQSDRVR